MHGYVFIFGLAFQGFHIWLFVYLLYFSLGLGSLEVNECYSYLVIANCLRNNYVLFSAILMTLLMLSKLVIIRTIYQSQHSQVNYCKASSAVYQSIVHNLNCLDHQFIIVLWRKSYSVLCSLEIYVLSCNLLLWALGIDELFINYFFDTIKKTFANCYCSSAFMTVGNSAQLLLIFCRIPVRISVSSNNLFIN